MKVKVFLLIVLSITAALSAQVGERCSVGYDLSHPNFIEHPTNCSQFLMCGNGHWVEMECPARLHFNSQRMVCDWPSSAKCKNFISDPPVEHPPFYPGIECLPSTDKNSPRVVHHPIDCGKFMICNGNWVEMKCPKHLLFSIETLHCEFPDNTKCCETCDRAHNQECQIDGSRVVHEHCEKYYECHNFRLFVKDCPDGQHYDPIKGTCIPGACNESSLATSTSAQGLQTLHELPDCPVDGALFPHYQDCEKFFICNGGTLVEQTCPPNLYFSIAHDSCEEKASAVCAG